MSDIEFLQEAVTRGVVRNIITDTELNIDEAITQFASSRVFSLLMDNETKLYRESPDYVYELFCQEQNSS